MFTKQPDHAAFYGACDRRLIEDDRVGKNKESKWRLGKLIR